MKPSTLLLVVMVLLAACTSRQPRVVAPLSYAPVPAAPAESFRDLPPRAAPLVVGNPLSLAKARLPSGMEIVLVERHTLPVFSARLLIARGARDLGDRREELLDLGMEALLREHASSPDASPEIRPGADCDSDACVVSVSGTYGAFEAGLGALADLAMRPRYVVTQLGQVRRSWESWVQGMGANSRRAVDINARYLLFPKGDSYAPPAAAERETIGRLRIEDLQTVHEQLFQPEHATLVVAGDVSFEELRAMAERKFGAWKQTRPALPLAAEAPPFPGPGVGTVLVADPSALVHAYLVARAPEGRDPDIESLFLLSRLLGTLSGSLSDEVRAAMGATYHITAEVIPGRLGSWWRIGGAFEPDKALPAMKAVLSSLREARDTGIDPEAFQAARLSAIGELRSQTGTVSGVTKLVADTLSRGLPVVSAAGRAGRIARLTAPDIQKTARTWLADNQLRLVVVGEKGDIDYDFNDLGIGKVEWRTRRGEATR